MDHLASREQRDELLADQSRGAEQTHFNLARRHSSSRPLMIVRPQPHRALPHSHPPEHTRRRSRERAPQGSERPGSLVSAASEIARRCTSWQPRSAIRSASSKHTTGPQEDDGKNKHPTRNPTSGACFKTKRNAARGSSCRSDRLAPVSCGAPSRWELEVVVVDTNTFITPARAIQFRLSRDLRDEWLQGRPRCHESPICGCETVELGINIIKSQI